MSLLKRKKCLICRKKCGEVFTTVKYRYEDDAVGEVYVCEKCSKEHDLEYVSEDHEQSI
jgi:protein-arginine kinase activator protein McsA